MIYLWIAIVLAVLAWGAFWFAEWVRLREANRRLQSSATQQLLVLYRLLRMR